MDLRLTTAILTGKFIGFLTKLKGGGATAAPGLYALKIDRELVKKLTSKTNFESIVISATNGKTTTSRIIANILENSGVKIIHNRQGSNLLRGLASTLITKSSLTGKFDHTIGIWETDEATLHEVIESTNPKTVILINLFRDQLDRYGEVDAVRAKWQKVIENLPKSTTLILNADDPGISFLAKFHKGKVLFFGVNDKKINLPDINNVADARFCLNCGNTLTYNILLSAHMGHYYCSNCDFKRPTPEVNATDLKFKPDYSTSLKLTINHELLTISYLLPGLYNVYNIMAAAACASDLNIKGNIVKKSIENFSAAFGRFQKLDVGGKKIIIFLIKNPAGANEVIRTIVGTQNQVCLLAILNDNIADGKDISWIWDTSWEAMSGVTNKVSVSGTRAWDLANRLKYAEIKLSTDKVYKDINYSVVKSVKIMGSKDTLIILPTYTALLGVQKSLSKLGAVKWHTQ